MNLNTLLLRVAERTSLPVKRHHLQHAIRIGVVPHAEASPNGWRRFDDRHVEALTTYMTTVSRAEGQGNE